MRWTHEWLDEARLRADPPADHLIEQLVLEKGQEAARNIFNLLIRNIQLPYAQLPTVVEQFVLQHSKAPAWVDWQKISLAEQVFLDHGPKFLVFLYFKSLPILYSFANGAQVLQDTGRMSHEGNDMQIFSRRIAETGQFLLDIMSPGGLNPGGMGIQASLKVRLIHAAIRYFVQQRDWDTDNLGIPINQEDMASTLMTFSVSMIEGMELMDIDLPLEEAEAYLHAWQVVGHYLGIEQMLIPQNVSEGKALLQQSMSRQSAPSEAGRILTRSLVQFSEGTLPGKLFDNLPRILIRRLNGARISRILDVRPKYGLLYFLLPGILKRWLGWIERLEDLSEPASDILERFSQKLTRKMVGFFNSYKDSPFRISPELKESWGLAKP